ncbi:MAG: hypothetical protein WC872_01695 [Candidatus Absconditabacterales bacterium]|jgi:hypothetical protein
MKPLSLKQLTKIKKELYGNDDEKNIITYINYMLFHLTGEKPLGKYFAAEFKIEIKGELLKSIDNVFNLYRKEGWIVWCSRVSNDKELFIHFSNA